MNNIIYFKPRDDAKPKQNLDDFISHCRDNLKIYDEQGGWEVNNWKYIIKNKTISMRFSIYSRKSNWAHFEPFREPFLSFSKAYIRYHQSIKQVSSVGNKMVALRMIYDSLLEINNDVDILSLDGVTISKTMELTEDRVENKDRLNKIGYQIQKLFIFLRDKRITPTLPEWVNPWPKIAAKAERTDKESRKWQDKRCPTMHQMLSLADCFANAKSDKDKYWSSVIALLMFAPGRAGELAELTIDCLHYAENGSLGVRWYSEKGFGHTIKWVPDDLKPIVEVAHKRLLKIGQPARDAAKFAFENPGIFYRQNNCIYNYSEHQPLNALDVASAMNFSSKIIEKLKSKKIDLNSTTAWGYLGTHGSKWIQRLLRNEGATYKKLTDHIYSKYKTPSWPNLASVKRPVWESLVIIRDREFHNVFQPIDFSWVIPSVNQLNDQLRSRKGLKNPDKTLFERMGIKDEDGTEIKLTSHQIRVWLSTNAERSGMDAWQLAQWAGRARINDNRHYDLRTSKEREEQARNVLEFTERPTALEAIKLNLPVSYKDLGLNRIGIADITEYGMCTHDYAMSPCIKGGECMICKDHVCIKGMPNTIERIKRLEKLIQSQFKKAELDEEKQIFGANRWATYLGWKLAHIRTQRLRLESDDTPEGAVLWIPPEHDPSPVKRALAHSGLETTVNKKDEVSETITRKLLGLDHA
jgi:hypothetical protein